LGAVVLAIAACGLAGRDGAVAADAASAPVPLAAPPAARTILGEVIDGTRSIDEPALWLLLDRSSSAPLDTDFARPRSVSRQALIDNSSTRRGFAATVNGRFVSTAEITLSDPSRAGTSVHSSIIAVRPSGDPIQVVTLDGPVGLRRGDSATATGYYLKYRRDDSADARSDDEVLVPIVVARRLMRAGVAGRRVEGERRAGLIAAGVVALAVVYFWLRRRVGTRPVRRTAALRTRSIDEAGALPVDFDALSDEPSPDQTANATRLEELRGDTNRTR